MKVTKNKGKVFIELTIKEADKLSSIVFEFRDLIAGSEGGFSDLKSICSRLSKGIYDVLYK